MYKPPRKPEFKKLKREFVFKTSRSSGAGGQHVNKVETKVTLLFSVFSSQVLTTEQKEHLTRKWKINLESNGIIMISSSKKRSQLANKRLVLSQLEKRLNEAFIPEKHRFPTRVPRKAIRERLENKKRNAERKESRKKIII